MSLKENCTSLYDPTASKSEKLAAIRKIRESALYLSRYNDIKATDGRNIDELTEREARLVRNHVEEEQSREYSAIPHYSISLDDAGVVKVQVRTPEELLELLLGGTVKVLNPDEISDLLSAWDSRSSKVK